jgi:hypothetical protein
MHTIYLVRKDDKPVYVGYTSKSIEKRWLRHIKNSKNPKYPLHYAIKKHGVDSFTIEMLYESDDNEHTLNYMEHHYIWLYRTYWEHGGYNLTLGGEGRYVGMTEKELCENGKRRSKAYYESNKEKRKSQVRIWKDFNRDKTRAWDRAYREANKDKIKDYYKANKDKICTQQKAHQEANKDKRKAYQKAWYEANKDTRKAYQKAWREANKESIKARK